jgi:hypothetical protein
MVDFLIFLNLITQRAPVDPEHYLSCEQSAWMRERILSSELLNAGQKLDFVTRTWEGTDPSCKEDHNPQTTEGTGPKNLILQEQNHEHSQPDSSAD